MRKINNLLFKLVLFFTIFLSEILTENNFHLNNKSYDDRIINGIPAKKGQFPWQVIIKRYKMDTLWCGGSIISPNLILTAAHCLDIDSKTILVAYGSIKLNDFHKLIKSKNFIKHPEYNSENLNNDIGLIKLPQSIIFDNNVNKIRLVSYAQANNSFEGAFTYVTGFGYISDEKPDTSDFLLYANMFVITNNECRNNHPQDSIIDSTICARGIQNGNICIGDSGGAMVIKQNGEYLQIGINSFVSYQGCEQKIPAGFVRVGSFLDFINKHL